MGFVTLETERLRLREWTDDDALALKRIQSDPEVMQYQPDGAVAVEANSVSARSQMETWEKNGYGPWAVEDKESGRFIGSIGLYFPGHWPDPEVSWVLDKEFWNQGFATEGAGAALRFAFEVEEFDRVISVCQPGNAASERVMQKLGMTRTDISTDALRSIPVVVYAITNKEWRDGPRP